jgi:thiamine biosynthesis protein ThiS
MTTRPFTVRINGENRQVQATTVAAVVEELGLPGPTLLIEQNGEALQRSEWPDRLIKDGDQFEILRVAAGG